MAFDLTEMLEKAEGTDGSDTPEVDASLTPDDNPNPADKTTDEGQSDPGAQGADPGASGEDAPKTDEPELPEEPPVSQNEPANVAQVREWGRTWEKDAKEARTELRTAQEQLSEYEATKPLFDALLTENVDVHKFCDEMIAHRGQNEFSDFIWGLYALHTDQFAAELFKNPAEIQDASLRKQVEEFNKFKSGKEQPDPAREDVSSEGSGELSDEEIELLPPSMQKQIRELREFRKTALQDIEELKNHRKQTEQERLEKERKDAESTVAGRKDELNTIFNGVIDNLISKVSFSTAVDEKIREEENAYYRKTIRSNLTTDMQEKIRTDASTRKTITDLNEKFIQKGDRLGSKALLQKAKVTIQALIEPHIRKFEKRSSAEVDSLNGSKEKPPVVIPSTGHSAPILAPAEPKRKAFDMSALEQKASVPR
jgi:hypothetical protein